MLLNNLELNSMKSCQVLLSHGIDCKLYFLSILKFQYLKSILQKNTYLVCRVSVKNLQANVNTQFKKTLIDKCKDPNKLCDLYLAIIHQIHIHMTYGFILVFFHL